jgi:hypothetical protein
MLQGYKTYIIAALMVAIGAVKLFTGDIDLVTFLNSQELLLLLNGLGLATLRSGIAKL